MQNLKTYAKSLPYATEPYAQMMEMLDFILLRITQCVEAKDFDVGLLQWDSMLTYWSMLKYPIPRDRRIQLARIYFYVSVTPGVPTQIIATCADGFKGLTKSKKITIKDMRLPWKPVYDILHADLFLTRRQFEYTQVSWCMGYIADNSRKFFHPAAIDEMLSTILPSIDGTKLDHPCLSILSPDFLPLTHPQSYLPMLFRMWESINSYMYDERMLYFLSRLAELHVSPEVSDPRKLSEIPDDARSEGEGRPCWSKDDLKENEAWPGLYKDVGIFTDHQWQLLMCKCLGSMEIPLADAGSLTTGPSADNQAAFEIGRLPKPGWRIASLARIIVYSMCMDGPPVPPSNAATPLFTPLPSGMNTPDIHSSTLGDYLSAPLGRKAHSKHASYIGGSIALDSLARLIASTESFFHPSNSGAWTADLSAFIKYIVYDFNRRWHEEELPTCKTPMHRRLTRTMKRELVKSLRTVALLAIFSPDPTTVVNIQSCLKSMSVMEPDLILDPILERAVPSLEALVETQRTIAVIKALGAVAPAIVSRGVYYPGAKHLVEILHLLIPGIDLNDPSKTYIKFGDLTTAGESSSTRPDSELPLPSDTAIALPSPMADDPDISFDPPGLSKEEEDALLKDSTRSFPDWVASFIRRVIQLLENLPEEGPNGTAGGATEVQVVDAVTGACNQICVHLSEPLYDLVLRMVFDYASSNVRSNAVRAIHQLVECVANADPEKTLAKFLPFCSRNIRTELENGASSLRTTSASSPLPSDATLHWNLAILRGTVYNDGRAVLKHQEELMSLLHLLHKKALSKRGFSWSGKLLSSLLLTISHTYPLENKFVNPDEWSSDVPLHHHRHWGKVYHPDDVTVSWHVPSFEEIEFTLRIFRELVEPSLVVLNQLLEPHITRNATWRNDFCRHLSLVRNAFSGIPTLAQEILTREEIATANMTNPRHQYITSLKRQFGNLLHKASVSLRQQGEENTLDAVHMLVRAIRTYLLEYGDSRDSYFLNESQYESEKNVARQYAHQKVWPRAVYVRRARYYHSARLRWNSLERRRGPLEDHLIDDLVEWSVWQYAIIRESSQSVLEAICSSYDGVRRRALPALYKSLEPGTDDDRMKGALWTLNSPPFGKFAISEPTLAPELIRKIFGCQQNEKPSIQDCVSVVSENCLNNFVEPYLLVENVTTPELNGAISRLQATLRISAQDHQITQRCHVKRVERIELMNSAIQEATALLLEIGNSPKTHWKYEIFAIRCLRTLYAQRSVMKVTRNIKLRTFCHDPTDLALSRNHNPLQKNMPVKPLHEVTTKFLCNFKVPVDTADLKEPIFLDKNPCGWIAWPKSIALYTPPDASSSTFQPWEKLSTDTVAAIRGAVMDASFWEKLSGYYSEENHETTITQDNVSCVKSIFQILEDEPFGVLQPILEKLIADKDQNKQRAAAELLAGLLGGSKHWPTNKQRRLWDWFKPYIKQIFNSNIKTDTLMVWTSFVEYIFYKKDPRRVQPLVDYLMEEFHTMDYNGEMSFDAVKILSLFRAFYEELGWKFSAWADDAVERCWNEINSEHDDVRAYIGEIFAFTESIKRQAKPSLPTAEAFVKECRVLPVDFDIMGMRGTYHKGRILELVQRFKIWRNERLPGVRAFQSTYDRVGITVCKWLYLTLHDIHAISVFDYILPLMPELFRFTEVNDNDELAARASTLLVRMCGVTPPTSMIDSLLDAIFEAIQSSPSWRVRLKALPLMQVFYFRQVALISETKVVEILEVLCKCLDDEVVEVREMAATTLSGILRLSPRRSVLTLKDRFVRLAKNSHIPSRQHAGYNKAIRQRHAAILGICALVDSYPYTVEKWMPELLTNILAEHTYDPIPISTTVRKCASNFKKTHQDTWHEDSKRFNDDQLTALSTLLTGSSYCKLSP
ncbi:hypothetical protein BD779DRAFT_1607219 [Infundibulicybe gibba]|nr:hypothetical protein BD779DRAFT_1607219 [Infundibulicybe gibba]